MSKYKDFLLGVEELVFEALENGAKDTDSVYAYVYMYEPRATTDLVESIIHYMNYEAWEMMMANQP